MRVIVMFDLPVLTSAQRREYTRFRKFLLKSGFVMQQESIYSKLALNTSIALRIEDNVRKNKPSEGLVQMLTITEKQYGRMELLVGETQTLRKLRLFRLLFENDVEMYGTQTNRHLNPHLHRLRMM